METKKRSKDERTKDVRKDVKEMEPPVQSVFPPMGLEILSAFIAKLFRSEHSLSFNLSCSLKTPAMILFISRGFCTWKKNYYLSHCGWDKYLFKYDSFRDRVCVVDWPSCSPDLSSINICVILCRNQTVM